MAFVVGRQLAMLSKTPSRRMSRWYSAAARWTVTARRDKTSSSIHHFMLQDNILNHVLWVKAPGFDRAGGGEQVGPFSRPTSVGQERLCQAQAEALDNHAGFPSTGRVTDVRTSVLRPWLAAVLALVLLFAGAGRGWSAASSGPDVVPSIPGVTVHICHADGSGGPAPGEADQHDCCDLCALCAPLALPGQPDLTAPARVVHYVSHAAALQWAPIVARPRSPRLAQGPPAA